MRMYLILGSEGDIVAAVPADSQEVRSLPKTDEESNEFVSVEFRPIPESDQTIYNVELPSELEQLSGVELQQALTRYQVKPPQASLIPEAELVLRDSYGS